MNRTKLIVHRVNQVLNQPISIILILLFLFIYFARLSAQAQTDNRTILEGIKETSQSTKAIVAKQDETLKAIQQVAQDNKLISEQKTNIIICMLQIPVAERTTDTVTNCRKQVETQGSATNPGETPPPAVSQSSNSDTQNNSSSTNNTQTPPSDTRNNVEKVLDSVSSFIGGILNPSSK